MWLRYLCLFCVVGALSACGQYGKLYLPNKPQPPIISET